MLIEFELQGSRALHKGIFDTSGFWVKYEASIDEGLREFDDSGVPIDRPDGYKIYSHFSFAYYHTDKAVVDLVYSRLVSVLRGSNSIDIEGVGYFRRLNK